MIEVAGFEFESNLAAITCRHLLEGEQVTLFFHDDDGDVQILCGGTGHSAEDGRVVGLGELMELHPALDYLPIVAPGFHAILDLSQSTWIVLKTEDQD